MKVSTVHVIVALLFCSAVYGQTIYEPDNIDQIQGSTYGAPVSGAWARNFVWGLFAGQEGSVYTRANPGAGETGLLDAPANTDGFGSGGLLATSLRRNSNPNGRGNQFNFKFVGAPAQNVVYYYSEVGFVNTTVVTNGTATEVVAYNNRVNSYLAGSFGDSSSRPSNAPFGTKLERGARYDGCNADIIFVASSVRNADGHVSVFSYNTETALEETGTLTFEAFISRSGAAGFAHDISYSNGKLAVSAPDQGDGEVHIFELVASTPSQGSTDCVFSANLRQTLKPLDGFAASNFGLSVSYGSGSMLTVGSPAERGEAGLPTTGAVYIFTGNTLSLKQRVYPTLASFAETKDGMEMGFDVKARTASYVMAGAPGAFQNAGAGYFIRLDAASSQYFIEYMVSHTGSLQTTTRGIKAAARQGSNAREGEIVEFDGCRTFYLGAAGTSTIYGSAYDVSAFFPGQYCTCTEQAMAKTYPVFNRTDGAQSLCQKKEHTRYLQCIAGNAPWLCNYKAMKGYRLTEPEVEPESGLFECFKPENEIIRKRWTSNCLFEYSSVGSKTA